MIQIKGNNLQNYLDLDIVAFQWAAPGACGEPGGVEFITRCGKKYHTNYVFPEYGVSIDDLCKLFPPLAEFRVRIFGGGTYPEVWKDKYLGLGNYLVIHDSLWEDFTRIAKEELCDREMKGEGGILYYIWDKVILRVLKQRLFNNISNEYAKR